MPQDPDKKPKMIHQLEKFSALVPRYVTRFKCIGAECEDTCCSGWQVAIDSESFRAYQASKNQTLRERFQTKIIPLKLEDQKPGQHAKINLDPETIDCIFLENRLCAIQKELGEDYLSNTCFDFPRSSRIFGGQFEQSCTLACPEAARKALIDADAFEFVESEISARPTSVLTSHFQMELPVALRNDIRTFCIQLIRSPDLRIWERLALLGQFCKGLDEAIKTGPPEVVLMFLNQFAEDTQAGRLLQLLDETAPDPAIQSYFFVRLWYSRSNTGRSQNQRDLQSSISAGLGFEGNSDIPELSRLIENYLTGLDRLSEALIQAPHLLEHYLINEMFRELFPFGEKLTYEHFITLSARFGIVRLMLAGYCRNATSTPKPEEIARVIQVFCRRYLHEAKFLNRVNEALSKENLDDLPTILRMLKTR